MRIGHFPFSVLIFLKLRFASNFVGRRFYFRELLFCFLSLSRHSKWCSLIVSRNNRKLIKFVRLSLYTWSLSFFPARDFITVICAMHIIVNRWLIASLTQPAAAVVSLCNQLIFWAIFDRLAGSNQQTEAFLLNVTSSSKRVESRKRSFSPAKLM